MAATQSEAEAMHELAKQLWERYFKARVSEELLGHSLDGYKATVITNNGDGTLTVKRPFDEVSVTLKCPPGLETDAQPGDQVIVVTLGNMSNSFVLCRTDLSGLGGAFPFPAELDFSAWDAGYFSETMENGETYSYLVDFDSGGRPVKIYDETHECTVVWQ